MKFAAAAASFVALAGVASASVASVTELVERDASELCSYGTAGLQGQMAFVYPLFESCKSALNGNFANPWSNSACVAAAIVGSPGLVRDSLSCDSADIPATSSLPYLDYGVYADIVGSCAYASTACGITQQNFVDFIYTQIGDEASATWPSDSGLLVSTYITPLMDWTATGSSIPYANFNDWLHYAPDDVLEDC
ncbi:hypothetical protein PENSPDRAFT_659450 [Peniophora sp. CONT]|nr:hypothetical protein PENSPDRAFT_659450 [Peniophora sp. CONT]